MTKVLEKTVIGTILFFYPLPILNKVEKQWSKIASSYVMGWQWWKTMIKNCVKLCYGFSMLRNNDQKLRHAISWVRSVEKEWPKIVPSYVMDWQCWEKMIKNCVKLCYGLTKLRKKDQKLRQAMLWVDNVDKHWSKIVSSYVMGSQC